MSELREKIRKMVRERFIQRILEESEKDDKGERVYRSSNYETIWSTFDTGSKSEQKSKEATKNDFVRWFMKTYVLSPNSTLKLKPEDLAKAKEIYENAKTPDDFIEELNLNRWLFSNSGIANDADPVYKILTFYDKTKDIGNSHIDYKRLGDLKNLPKESDGEKKYDRDPEKEKKSKIADYLSADATETTTRQSVADRYDAALKHVSGDKGILALLSDFLKNPESDQNEKMRAREMLSKLNKIVENSVDKYSQMFTDCMVESFEGVSEEDESAQQKAFAEGIAKFADLLRNHGVKSIGSQEINVFNDVVTRMASENQDVLDMIIHTANNREDSSMYIDEIIVELSDGFREEMKKQTNFNSIGDFIDQLPEVKVIRKELNSIASRGRPKGSKNKSNSTDEESTTD